MNDPSDPTPDAEQTPAAAPRFAAGESIPGLTSWVLARRLGGGGFGEVWLACHAWKADEPPRAVKFCTEPTFRHRLATHEKNVVRRVMKYAGDHPNVVPLLDYNLDGETPWLMYEYVEGGTLAELIGQWRELPLPKRLGRAVRALHAIAGALARCHRLDPPLVHRDRKPANVLMAGNVPRVTDFGIGSVAMPKDASAGGPTALAARLPTAMRVSGTRLYAPPEQLLGAPPSPRDDVYALGVMAFQLVVGDPTAGPGPDAEDELRELKVPAELTSLIVRSVALNADRRPADAGEWEATLGALIRRTQGGPGAAEVKLPPAAPARSDAPPARPPREPGRGTRTRNRRPALLVAAVCAVCALLALVARALR